ncbi:MAG: SDR family oxidoreductase [Oscillospiraceae bacterium]|nr:SDR family oxidoreductase [Oscillospiraceae bacterium]
MKILFIGGTGTISMAITKRLAQEGHELYLLNRGNRNEEVPESVKIIKCDISDEQAAAKALEGMSFDCVGEFIGFVPEQVQRDFRLFNGRTKQYIYISSASAYQKPMKGYTITEETPLDNPFWGYSRNKKACEKYLMERYRTDGFPVTIVRPSHTYDERSVPLGVHGTKGSYQVVKRIKEGKPVLIHGDGTSLWTLTHSSDFAVAYTGLIGNPKAIGEAFHITSDFSVPWNEIYDAIADTLGVMLDPVYISSEMLNKMSHGKYDFVGSLTGDKANSVVFDNSKIKELVPEFEAKVTPREGIRAAIEYIMAHEELQIEDEDFDRFCDRAAEAVEDMEERFTW